MIQWSVSDVLFLLFLPTFVFGLIWNAVRNGENSPNHRMEILLNLAVPLTPIVFKTRSKVSTPIRKLAVRNRYLTNSTVWLLLFFGLMIGMASMYVFLSSSGHLCS